MYNAKNLAQDDQNKFVSTSIQSLHQVTVIFFQKYIFYMWSRSSANSPEYQIPDISSCISIKGTISADVGFFQVLHFKIESSLFCLIFCV